MNEQSFEDSVLRISERNPTYNPEAYFFLREGLDYISAKLKRNESDNHHVTGAELCEGLREYALEQFGPLASFTLSQWGVLETADFGNMVYELIAEGVFGKSASDKKEDFDNVYSFPEAFLVPFLPESPLS